jgi:arylamine N-acetyltransferase
MGYILGDFFTNSSGHSASEQHVYFCSLMPDKRQMTLAEKDFHVKNPSKKMNLWKVGLGCSGKNRSNFLYLGKVESS